MTEYEIQAKCERCGIDCMLVVEDHINNKAIADPAAGIDPLTRLGWAQQLGCPRTPRMCGTFTLTNKV